VLPVGIGEAGGGCGKCVGGYLMMRTALALRDSASVPGQAPQLRERASRQLNGRRSRKVEWQAVPVEDD
jgi:hypothetical protein